jgi:hypothetical protein
MFGFIIPAAASYLISGAPIKVAVPSIVSKTRNFLDRNTCLPTALKVGACAAIAMASGALIATSISGSLLGGLFLLMHSVEVLSESASTLYWIAAAIAGIGALDGLGVVVRAQKPRSEMLKNVKIYHL